MKIDFHSHILPNIDDGARNIEESIEILDSMTADGVDIVVATPHFYCTQCDIDTFIERRDSAFEQLKPHLKPEHPKILLGAEVLYNPVFVGNDLITKLCIQGTDFLLLEMPYEQLSNGIIRNVEQIATSMDVKLIIAHIDRYLHFTSYKELSALMNLEILGQLNAKSVYNKASRKNCFKLIKDGFVHVLGTDFHRVDSDYALLGEVEKILNKKFGNGYTLLIEHYGKMVLRNESIDEFYN